MKRTPLAHIVSVGAVEPRMILFPFYPCVSHHHGPLTWSRVSDRVRIDTSVAARRTSLRVLDLRRRLQATSTEC